MNSYKEITQDLAQKLQEEDELRYRYGKNSFPNNVLLKRMYKDNVFFNF